jgi:Lrp/AsnC family transcriptional regulator for asnA, asnC and gidA
MKGKNILDETNRFIISEVIKDGRVKYTKLANQLGITPAAVKERVERLIKNQVMKPTAMINAAQFFPVTAGIGIEADADGIAVLTRKLRNCPLVVHMTKTSGNHNLILTVVAENFQQLESFLTNQIRSEPGIKHVEVNIGNSTTIIPDFQHIRLYIDNDGEHVPCGLHYQDKEVCLNCPGLVNLKKAIAKKNGEKAEE